MKRLILILCLTCSFTFAEDPILAVAIMIKNEAHSIEDTLTPLIEGGITAFLVFDTGSTDETLPIVERLFKKHPKVKGIIKQEPFVDFSTSRNRALHLAKEAFPKTEFLLMPDAEWILRNIPQLLTFCKKEREASTPNYLVRVLGGTLDYHSTRLIRANSPSHYVGKVHELITPSTHVKVPDPVYLEQRRYDKGVAQSKERWKRDRKLLELEFFENPTDARTVFYLAQTCACLEDNQAAYHYYLIRTKLNGWTEENYMTYYRLAEVTQELAKAKPELLPEALHYYLEAYNLRPTRAEPLIKIADHYLQQEQYPLSYLFAAKASQIPYPEGDILFVDKYLYDYTRYDILSRCAWYVNEKEAGHAALKKALEYYPDAEHLRANLAFYE